MGILYFNRPYSFEVVDIGEQLLAGLLFQWLKRQLVVIDGLPFFIGQLFLVNEYVTILVGLALEKDLEFRRYSLKDRV